MNPIWVAFCRLMMKLVGWRVIGELPPDKKVVVAAAHHTANWDGIMLILVSGALNRPITWMAKHTLFWFPLGPIIKALGALAVNRSTSQNAVQQVVEEFKKRDDLWFVLAPEGTRRKVSRWKRGFYYIATGANVPIVLVGIDYARKAIVLGPIIQPSGDIQADMVPMREFFKTIVPKYPEKMGEMVIHAEHHEA